MDTSLHGPFLDEISAVYSEVMVVLDERQRRLVLGSAARRLGRGGIKKVAAAVGVDPETVGRGVKEIAAGPVADGRVRAVGAGRPPVTATAPGVAEELEHLVEPVTRGDPESPLRWTSKSTQKLADELTARGFSVGPRTVSKLLKTCGYRLQANAKVVEGRQHPDRDAQFEYVNSQAVEFWLPGIRSSRWIRRNANWSATSKTAAGSGNRSGSRPRSMSTTSPVTRWGWRCRTGSTTWPPTPAGSTSAPIMTPPRRHSWWVMLDAAMRTDQDLPGSPVTGPPTQVRPAVRVPRDGMF